MKLLPLQALLLLATLQNSFAQTRFYDENRPIPIQTEFKEVVVHFNTTADFNSFLNTMPVGFRVVKEIPKYLAVVIHSEIGFSQSFDLNAIPGFSNIGIKNSYFARKLDDGFPLYLSHKMLFAPNESEDPMSGEISEIIKRYGNGSIRESEFGLYYIVEIDNPLATLALANALVESDLVKWAHPDFYANHKLHIDPLYSAQFQMHNTGQNIGGTTGTSDIDCDAPEAWAISTGSASVTVAVIDDGLVSHPDMNTSTGISRILAGYTPATGGNGTSVGNAGHGVACGGIIGASHNDIGVRGLAPNVRLRSVNIFQGSETTSDLADAFTWAKNQGVDVMSNSWGYSSCTLSLSALNNAISDARTTGRSGKGCVIVFASGNSYGTCVEYPADLTYVMGVGAVTSLGFLSNYSNQGPALDIVAPSNAAPGQSGAGVRTTDRPGSAGYSSGDYTTGFGGTSAACPLVAGAAALVVSVNPDLTDLEIRTLLQTTATDMGAVGFDNTFGHGRVNAHQALLAAAPVVNACANLITSFPSTQSFESGLGNWSQATDDDFDWTIGSGTTPSNGTGPSAAANGTNYLFIESSSPNYPSKFAIVQSPCMNLTSLTNATISFSTHLFGLAIGELRLEGSTDGSSWNTIWSLTGDQGNAWSNQSVSLASLASSGTARVRFRASTTTSFTGDIAIDQVVIGNGSTGGPSNCTSTISSLPYSEGFESSDTQWIQSTNDNFNWIRRSGGTPSASTGPSSAVEGSFYYYIESSAPNFPTKTAILSSPCVNLDGLANATFTFSYHMFGATMGTMKLESKVENGAWTALWEQSGNQGNTWVTQNVSLNNLVGNAEVSFRFVATTSTSFTSDMAIDQINIQVGSPAPNPLTCSADVGSLPYTEGFEAASNLWDDATDDDFNWSRRSGSTPSNATGPTGASEGSFYYYIESSAPNHPSKSAILSSPCFDLSDVPAATFSFNYHMFGASMGNLALQVQSENNPAWATVWSEAGNQGGDWLTADVNIDSYAGENGVKLRFTAMTSSSFTSDIAIDALSLTTGFGSPSGACPIINFNALGVQTYGVMQDNGQFTISGNGSEMTLTQNAWKSTPFNYTVGTNTVLSFEFRSTAEGEIHGVGFDNDNNISSQLLFQVHGSQNWGILNFNTYSGSDWVTYTIPAGIYVSGSFDRLVFAGDNDANLPGVNGSFRNVRVYELGSCIAPTVLDFADNAAIFGNEEDGEAAAKLEVFPNPAIDRVTVAFAGSDFLARRISIFDASGRQVLQTLMQGNRMEIELSHLAAGSYLVQLYEGDRLVESKLLLKTN